MLSVIAAAAIATLLLAAMAVVGLERGWWRVAHPDPRRFPVWGVDVSHHQGHIDWARVAREPHLAFAYIKASEGSDWTDSRFRDNASSARAAGLRVGAYHFFGFCSSGREQAAHFLSVTSAERGDPLCDPRGYGAFFAHEQIPAPLWIRSLWGEPRVGSWAIWQFANRAHVSGIEPYVDLDVLGEEVDLRPFQ